jgi:hypothetical protein
MVGPYSLRQVSTYSLGAGPGAYMLSRDGRTVHYVGRSDTDIGARINSSAAEGRYTHFWCEHASSARDAFLNECTYYHRYNPPDNTNHPAVPPGTSWRCPVQGCHWS